MKVRVKAGRLVIDPPKRNGRPTFQGRCDPYHKRGSSARNNASLQGCRRAETFAERALMEGRGCRSVGHGRRADRPREARR